MRYFVLILIIFLCTHSFAQVDECQIGKDSAKSDFSKGILKIFIFGSTDSYTFGRVLKSEYGIHAIYHGCIVEEVWECYSEFMGDKIKQIYGVDIFERVADKARQLDSSGNGDRLSSFPGGEQKLMTFLYCNLDLARASYSTNNKGKVNLAFTINTDGKVADIKILHTPNEKYGNEALRIMSLMPNWTYATQNGKGIKQQLSCTIVFDDEWKRKYCP